MRSSQEEKDSVGRARAAPYCLPKYFTRGIAMSECAMSECARSECLSRSAANESVLPAPQSVTSVWRTPAVIIACGCLIAAVAFGPRSALGFFLTPISSANHWGRDVFAFALAVQNLLWGAGQPIAGAIADRFGAAAPVPCCTPPASR